MPIGIGTDAHLVASRVDVKWWTVPFLFECFVLVEICHFEHTWTALSVRDIVPLLLFHCIDSFYRKVEVECVVTLVLL